MPFLCRCCDDPLEFDPPMSDQPCRCESDCGWPLPAEGLAYDDGEPARWLCPGCGCIYRPRVKA